MPHEPLPHDPRQTAEAEPDPALMQHIEALGLKTIEEYIAWCGQNGFSRRTDKDWRQRLKERAFVTRPVADARLAQRKSETRKPEKIIERIFRDDFQEDAVLQPSLKALCRAYESSKSCPQTKQAFTQLVQHVSRSSDLIGIQPVVRQFGQQEGNTFIAGLLALARHSAEWIRPITAWKRQTHNLHRQFSSLARHLFAEWPLPAFMDSVWFRGGSEEAIRQQFWFMCLGVGYSLRSLDLPLAYTKKMAHYFMQAPADFTVEGALRWGQIHGLGGDARFVRAILGTRLATNFEQDEFWTTVLRFFIAHPAFDLAQVGPIIDYIHHQRFVPQDAFVAPGMVERREPPQSNLTMKGRTPESLMRQVRAWHHSLAHVRHAPAQWPSSGIDGFEFEEWSGGNQRIWTIRELTSTKELVAEGQAMNHCVATYIPSCFHGIARSGRSKWRRRRVGGRS